VKLKQDSALGHIHQQIDFNKRDYGERDGVASSANSSPRYPQHDIGARTIIFAGNYSSPIPIQFL